MVLAGSTREAHRKLLPDRVGQRASVAHEARESSAYPTGRDSQRTDRSTARPSQSLKAATKSRGPGASPRPSRALVLAGYTS
jgi:hypothetical protein